MSANATPDTERSNEPVDTTDDDMLKFAEQADAAMTAGKPSPKFEEPAKSKPAEAGTAKPGEQGQDKKDAGKPDDQPADTKKPDDKKPDDKKPEDKKGEEKPAGEESEFVKAQKEQARQKEILAGFQKEKDEFRKAKDQLMGEVTRLRAQVAELSKKPAGPAKDKLGLTAEDYDEMAKDYAAKGNTNLEEAAKQKAAELRKQTAAGAAAGSASDFTSPEFQTQWQGHVQALIKEDPELSKPENPVVRAANILVNHETYGRFFKSSPDGIRAAVEVAKIMQAGEASEAKAKDLQTKLDAANGELTKAKAEVTRLTALTQPSGSHPSSPKPGEKKPEDMSDDEIMAAARAADQAQGGAR